MVSENWPHDNIVYKMFAVDLLHNAWSYYYGCIMTFFNDMFYIRRWYLVWIYGMMNKWNEIKVGAMNEYIDSKYKE
jgi:hypothetical protein